MKCAAKMARLTAKSLWGDDYRCLVYYGDSYATLGIDNASQIVGAADPLLIMAPFDYSRSSL